MLNLPTAVTTAIFKAVTVGDFDVHTVADFVAVTVVGIGSLAVAMAPSSIDAFKLCFCQSNNCGLLVL